MEKKPINQIVITMFDDGTMQFTGPMENKILCYGMLVAAQDIVANYKGPAAGIIPASSLPNGQGNGARSQ